jgi:choline dehydrogenase-like flavoprotein
MLSGIGSREIIEAVGIKHLVDLPDVGKNLKDHPIVANYWIVNSNNTFDDVLRNSTIFDADISQWVQNKTGLMSASPVNSFGFIRLPDNSTILSNLTDPSAGTF